MSKFKKLIRKINWYPPFLGAGIRVVNTNEQNTRFEVQLRQTWFNRNLFGTHFGGSLYTMCDPFYVFIITLNFGKGFTVWDKSATIEFLKPAKGTITGVFEIEESRLIEIKTELAVQRKGTYHFETYLLNQTNERVARIRKEVYVRLNRKA